MRTLTAIEAELKAASIEADKIKGIVSALTAERDEVRKCREMAILEDFDAGRFPRLALAERHGISPNTLASIMYRNDRSYRKKITPISHLSSDKRRHYAKLRRNGMGPFAARQAAEAVTT